MLLFLFIYLFFFSNILIQGTEAPSPFKRFSDVMKRNKQENWHHSSTTLNCGTEHGPSSMLLSESPINIQNDNNRNNIFSGTKRATAMYNAHSSGLAIPASPIDATSKDLKVINGSHGTANDNGDPFDNHASVKIKIAKPTASSRHHGLFHHNGLFASPTAAKYLSVPTGSKCAGSANSDKRPLPPPSTPPPTQNDLVGMHAMEVYFRKRNLGECSVCHACIRVMNGTSDSVE